MREIFAVREVNVAASRHKVPLFNLTRQGVACALLRIGADSRFRIEIRKLRVPRTTNQVDDVRRALIAIHAQFESWTREVPSQWLWSHRIWR
jgi:lauroyl/myristoyl acyltransferase